MIWGHAYLAFIETREIKRKFLGIPLEPQSCLIVTRDGATTRYVEWPKRFEWEWTFPWDQAWQYLGPPLVRFLSDVLMGPGSSCLFLKAYFRMLLDAVKREHAYTHARARAHTHTSLVVVDARTIRNWL